jgi:putative transposase
MGQPPRLTEILLPWEQAIVYFVTFCVEDRRSVLANETVFQSIKASLEELKNWHVLAGVVMPDHLHLFVTPTNDRGIGVGDFSTGFKRVLRKKVLVQNWEWQRRCFDRLLRSDESLQQKWMYARNNPVRAGLVEKWEDWPYYIDPIDKEGSYQVPVVPVGQAVGFQNRKGEKLTVSPTEEADSHGKLAASLTERQRREANSFPYTGT